MSHYNKKSKDDDLMEMDEGFYFFFTPFKDIDDEITNQEDVWEVIGIF
jgi:hypothetical protein